MEFPSLSMDDISREVISCDAPGCGMAGPQKRCTRCKQTYYCGVSCQKKHWKAEHKADCIDVNWMKQQIAGIGTKVPAEDEVDASVECGICLVQPIVDPFVIPDCKHAFCFGCLRRWQEQCRSPAMGGRITCPYCRAESPDAEGCCVERAMLYSGRCNAQHLPPDQRSKYQDLALAEVNKVISSNRNNLQAMFTKVEILLAMNRPAVALVTLEDMIKIHTEGRKNAEMVDGVLSAVALARAEDRLDDAERLLDQAEELRQLNLSRMGEGPSQLFDVYIKMAEAKQAMNDWEGANAVYINHMLAKLENGAVGTPPQQRMMWTGLSRCFYELGEYDKAINAGEAAIEMNRHFPGAHKYLALSQKESGDLEGARRTMARAVLYETPWDKANRERAFELYQELMADS